MTRERILPGRKVGDGWFFQEKIFCDPCGTLVGEQEEGSEQLAKYRHGQYPGYRCQSCKSSAERAYDSWATSTSRHACDDDDD